MVIGNGLMAQAFYRYMNDDNILIFASGVSSSKSCTAYDCAREEVLLRKSLDKCDGKILFVYFSSCSIASSNLSGDTYHTHKKKMEEIIQMNAKRYTIFRLPNVVGSVVNLDTLFYYLVDKVKKQKAFELWSGAKRNVMDIDDVVSVVNNIIDDDIFINETTNIANLNDVTVDEIVHEIAKYLGVDVKYSKIEHNDNYFIDTTKVQPIIDRLGLNLNANHLERIIKKYCGNLNLIK
jgi:nucleoside-diphosphate-sugar epimerase